MKKSGTSLMAHRDLERNTRHELINKQAAVCRRGDTDEETKYSASSF